MTMLTGRVVNGKIEVSEDDLPEGAIVSIMIHDDEKTVEVTPDEEAAILAAISEADRGELIPAEEVMAELRRQA